MLNLRQISSINTDLIPFSSFNLQNRICAIKSYIDDNILSTNEISDNDLVVVCIQQTYAYRTGIVGWLSTFASTKLSEYFEPKCFQKIFNTTANDFEVVSGIVSLISRGIPFLNIGVWDNKDNIFNKNIDSSILKYGYGFGLNNDSIPSIFNLKSNYLLKPVFDSGCAIYSNKKSTENGFEPWNLKSNNYYNTGIIWFNLLVDKEINIFQLIQICELKEKLEKKYSSDVKIYETYITGEFNIEFNLSSIILEIKDEINLLKKSGLYIFENDCITTNHIFSSNDIKNFKISSKKSEFISENNPLISVTIESQNKSVEIIKDVEITIKKDECKDVASKIIIEDDEIVVENIISNSNNSSDDEWMKVI